MATKGLTDEQVSQLLGYPKNFDPSDIKGTPRELLVNVKRGVFPTLKQGLEDQQAGEISIPRLARGVLQGTLIGDLNNQLEYSCDFILESKKNLKLRKFISAISSAIKRGIVAISDALGLEPTGSLSGVIAFIRNTTTYLKYIKDNFIDPIIEFQKYVLVYIQQLKDMIDFINNLPAKLKALLQTCLRQVLALLGSVFTSIITESLSGQEGIGAVITASQELVATATIAYSGVESIVKNSKTIASEVKGINLNIDINSTDFTDMTLTKSTIETYIKSIPNSAAVTLANPAPQQQRSTP